MLKTKNLDEDKVLFIVIGKDKAEIDEQIDFLKKIHLTVWQSMKLDIVSVVRTKDFAKRLNELQKMSDAKWKIYINAPIAMINDKLLSELILNSFLITDSAKCKMMGLLGSEMPLDGDYTQAQSFYGMYAYKDENREIQNYLGKDPIYYKSVHILESGFIATCADIPFDEKVGKDFVFAAQCLRYRKAGYDIGVWWRNEPWIVYDRDECMYNIDNQSEDYQTQLAQFKSAYKKSIQPLVSILIPAYNKPKFAQEALESALAQTYENVEIIIGDDSSNDGVKEMVKPYLKKYPHIQFYHHGGQLLKKTGVLNHDFIAEKSSGEFVQWLFHDDLLHPEKIYKMMNYFIRDLENNIGIVTSNRGLIDENSKGSDVIYNGHYMGRAIMFIVANCIGEVTTCLFRREDMFNFYPESNKLIYSTTNFCGVRDLVHGDLTIWLNILKSGRNIVFMSEPLSAFRRSTDPNQQSNNPEVHTLLPIDQLQFITIAWLNNLFFKKDEEYFSVCKKWPIVADRWLKPIQDDDSESQKNAKGWIIRLKETMATGNNAKIANDTIAMLVEHLPADENSILPLVRKNPRTGLWEKNNDGIERVYKQRWD